MYVAVTEAKDLDVLVMGTEALRTIGSSGRLLDLNADEAASIMSKYADRLIYCVPNDEEYAAGDVLAQSGDHIGEVPVGIDISDSLLVTRYYLYADGCALGISAYTQRLDSVELFLDFIL